MICAYADPPYLGCAVQFYGDHPEAAVYDTLDGHRALIDRLVRDYPDGWALSCTSGNLYDLLPLFPVRPRIAAWCKSFASFKPGVNPAYTWEPVLWTGGRGKRGRNEPTVRDYHVAPITLRRGVAGAKPETFCRWVFDLLGLTPEDELHDLFPGSGAVTRAWESFKAQRVLA